MFATGSFFVVSTLKQALKEGKTDDDFSVIVTVCRGPCALSIYSTHGTPKKVKLLISQFL